MLVGSEEQQPHWYHHRLASEAMHARKLTLAHPVQNLVVYTLAFTTWTFLVLGICQILFIICAFLVEPVVNGFYALLD
jgi:hypothetical protein